MSGLAKTIRRDIWGVAPALFFFLLGQAFIPRLGIQADEALFASPILPPRGGLGLFRLIHTHFALMLMSYLGTLKTLVMLPVLKLFGASVWSVREPMLLAGAASIWLFYLLLRRAVGETSARIGAVLLAADTLYLLTSCFDWGPVALQHLLLTAGMLLALRFYQERSKWVLALAFFAFGLALWDKALAIWMLSGMGVAAIVVFPRQLLAVLHWRRFAIAAGGLLVGALPLLIYNAGHVWDTFHGNFAYAAAGAPAKAKMLMLTADGGALLGYLNREGWATERPHAPEGVLQQTSAAVSEWTGHPRRSLLLYAPLLALTLVWLTRGPALRALLFALVAMLVAWMLMAVTKDAGGSAHHAILLWPLPQMAAAAAFGAAAGRLGRAAIVVFAAVAVLCGSSLLVTNEYYAQMVRNGGSVAWTDAMPRLNRYLEKSGATYVYCMDWGYLDSLRLLSMGKLPLREGSEVVSRPELSPADRAMVLEMIGDPRHLFVTHPREAAFFPGNDPKLERFAEQSGYRRENLPVIEDSYGRPMFEVYRFRAAAVSGPPERAKTP